MSEYIPDPNEPAPEPIADTSRISKALDRFSDITVKPDFSSINKKFSSIVGSGVFYDPASEEEIKQNSPVIGPLMAPFRKFNNLLAAGAGTIGKSAFKALDTSFHLTAGSIADAYEKTTGNKAEADRLERDLLALPDAYAGLAIVGAATTGSTIARTAKVERNAATIIDRAVQSVEPAKQRMVAKMIQKELSTVTATLGEEEKARVAVSGVLERLHSKKPPASVPQNVTAFQLDLLKATGGKPVASKTLTEQAGEIISGMRLDNDVLNDLIRTHKIVDKDIEHIIGKGATVGQRQTQESADFLHRLADLRLESATGNQAAGRALEALADRDWHGDRIHKFFEAFHKFESTRRGLMVSSLATAVRNATVATGRVGLDIMTDALDITLGRAGQKLGVVKKDYGDVKPIESFGATLEWLFSGNLKNKKELEGILKSFPSQYDHFTGRMMAQIESSQHASILDEVIGTSVRKSLGRDPTAVEKAVYISNVFNRTQEFIFRRAKFGAVLDTELKKVGSSLDAVIANNKTGAITENMIAKAVDEALSFTFAADPESRFVRKLVHDLTRVPGFTVEIPFPRFLTQSFKFLWEHSPAGLLPLLTRAERAKIAAGDTSTISKAAVGTAMQLAVYGAIKDGHIRMGDSWNEVYIGDKKIDLKPYQPFASQVFIADTVIRFQEGRIRDSNFTLDSITEGILSTAAQTGTGFEIGDSIIRAALDISKSNKEGHAGERSGSFLGSYLNSFLTPVAQLSDVAAQFSNKREAITRDTKIGQPGDSDTNVGAFFGALRDKVKSRIPVLKQDLPEKQISTREGPKESVDIPILRMALGVKVLGESNPLEKELGRLGFNYKDTETFTGVPAVDRAIAREMGVLSERKLIPLVESKGYQALDDKVKSYILSEQLTAVRKASKVIATAKNPELFTAFKILDMPADKMQMLESMQKKAGVSPENQLESKLLRVMNKGKLKERERSMKEK